MGLAQLPAEWQQGSDIHDSLPFDNEIPLGRQSFHRLPFQIGPEQPAPECCYLGFGSDAVFHREAVQIPVGQTASNVIFAHTLLESDLHSGGALGEVTATYVFHIADGRELRAPVRERFEIAALPMPWGGFPFLAMPDREEELMPRHGGEWGLVAARQIGAYRLEARAYWLWAWKNPQPDGLIESITIEPNGRQFIVAGITLGHVDEPPFYRTGKRTVKITLPQPTDAEQPFEMTW